MDSQIGKETLFDRIGGAVSIDALVEAFYAQMDARPEAGTIRRMHAVNLAPTKLILKRYLGEWMGGPPLYSSERGHPRLRMRHFRFAIGEAERDAWLICMAAALEQTVNDEALRIEIFKAFMGLADWMRNQPAAATAAPAT